MSAKKNVEKPEPAAQEAEKTGQVAEPAQGPKKVIYMGPTIRGVAVQGTVFEDGIPPELQKIAVHERAVNALIIPVKDLPRANRELATAGSALDILYKKAEKKMEELNLHK